MAYPENGGWTMRKYMKNKHKKQRNRGPGLLFRRPFPGEGGNACFYFLFPPSAAFPLLMIRSSRSR
jgi:hypothetical protein